MAHSPVAHSKKDFIGAWELADWRIEYDDGRITRPFGEQATGYIIYSHDGLMSASIASAERPSFAMANARKAAPHQKSAAFDSYFHYAGGWTVEGDDVVHSVTMALNPDFVGTIQRRLARFDGTGGLTLSAREPMADGTHRHHILEWRKRSE